ncbi:hypothetical protein CAPTEDRAFT_192915 [Capitella teleta]|uniref:SUEL-type lectin domain-containing protein n=1 Tax=Capitella teleta TaxID=283909 RepID=R7V804_CAPTE|nr:hypothetical protein CAPTEDRAFT_192915 [Capitella teleta]|eukprot:ELU11885.1 hypothetical protein CAPTEDRAFT_192915 [Capitella teleta]
MFRTVLILTGLIASLRADEVCTGEAFKPSCPKGEVIVVQSASLGVPHVGRCPQVDIGVVGCSVDVLSFMDYRCSGRPSCQVSLPDDQMDASGCPPDAKDFLLVEYQCTSVQTREIADCGEDVQPQELVGAKGAISSYKEARNQLYGQQGKCHWRVQSPKGTNIAFSILDFGTAATKMNFTEPLCHYVMTITDVKSGRKATVTCGGMERSREVIQTGSEAEIVRILKHTTHLSPEYLVTYTVTDESNGVEVVLGSWKLLMFVFLFAIGH